MATKWIDDTELYGEYLRWEIDRRAAERDAMLRDSENDRSPAAILWLEAALVAAGILALLWLWMW